MIACQLLHHNLTREIIEQIPFLSSKLNDSSSMHFKGHPLHSTQHVPIIPAQSKLQLVVIPTMKFSVQFRIGIPGRVFSFNWKRPLSVAIESDPSLLHANQITSPAWLSMPQSSPSHRVLSGQFQWNDKFSCAPNSAIHVSNPNCLPHILLPKSVGTTHSERFLWNNK